LLTIFVGVYGSNCPARRVLGHRALEDYILRIVATASHGFTVVILIVNLLVGLVVRYLRVDGVGRVVWLLDGFLLYGIGIPNATDDLFVFVLELLDALFELLEFFG
jgi:hypothetical protein